MVAATPSPGGRRADDEAGPRTMAIQEVVPGLSVQGPVPGLSEAVHDLIRRFHGAA